MPVNTEVIGSPEQSEYGGRKHEKINGDHSLTSRKEINPLIQKNQ